MLHFPHITISSISVSKVSWFRQGSYLTSEPRDEPVLRMPFISVDYDDLGSSLIESELFGTRRVRSGALSVQKEQSSRGSRNKISQCERRIWFEFDPDGAKMNHTSAKIRQSLMTDRDFA